MPLCIIPGPAKPKDLLSFLSPVLKELKELEQSGIHVSKGSLTINAKIFLLTATGDIPGVADLMRHSGHQSSYGCRLCTTKGRHPEGRHTGMYFPGEVAAPLRTKESLQSGDLVRTLCLNVVNFSYANYIHLQEHALYEPTPFAFLQTFNGPQFFGLDEMHFIGHGIARLAYRLLDKEFVSRDETRRANYPFQLEGTTLQDIGKAMDSSRKDIPTAFQGGWYNIYKSNYCRAVDSLDFFLYVVPALACPRIVREDAQAALMSAVTACSLALSWSIDHESLEEIER